MLAASGLSGPVLSLPPPWQIAGMIVLALILAFGVRRLRRAERERLRRAPEKTFLARHGSRLPPAIEVLAAAGQAETPQVSAGTTILRPTAGVRLVALVLGGTLMWLLYGPTRDVYVPDGWVTLAAALLTGYAIVSTVSFEARVDADQLVLVHLIHWRRVYRWRDLVAMRDDGGYMWRMEFTSGRARVPKHLVGMPGFLSLVAEHLDRKAAADARTARG